MRNSTIDQLHQDGWRGLWYLYSGSLTWKALVFPLLLSILVCLVFFVARTDVCAVLLTAIQLIVSITPNLLGFLLGGYAILMSFSNSTALKKMIQPDEVYGGASFFQMHSTVFAVTILSQVVALLTGLFLTFLSQVHLSGTQLWGFCKLYPFFNWCGIFLITFMIFYCIWCLKSVTLNVFQFSQLYHLSMRVDEMRKQVDGLDNENGKHISEDGSIIDK